MVDPFQRGACRIVAVAEPCRESVRGSTVGDASGVKLWLYLWLGLFGVIGVAGSGLLSPKIDVRCRRSFGIGSLAGVRDVFEAGGGSGVCGVCGAPRSMRPSFSIERPMVLWRWVTTRAAEPPGGVAR